MTKKIAVPTDNLQDGELLCIEYHDNETGEHIIDAWWDPSEEQTSENRKAFRAWADSFVEFKGYEVAR